jgi:hypothetical protein
MDASIFRATRAWAVKSSIAFFAFARYMRWETSAKAIFPTQTKKG